MYQIAKSSATLVAFTYNSTLSDGSEIDSSLHVWVNSKESRVDDTDRHFNQTFIANVPDFVYQGANVHEDTNGQALISHERYFITISVRNATDTSDKLIDVVRKAWDKESTNGYGFKQFLEAVPNL